MQIKTSIIPQKQSFVKIDEAHQLHLEAICVFAAIGFFLDRDTYWKDRKVLSGASINTLDKDNKLVNSKSWFSWHYSPRNITFKQALNEFTELFETIITEQTQGKKVILPLSGGLDSRTQAVALKNCNAEVFSYSYQFKNGYAETKIAKQIAEVCQFEFKDYTIPKGYLWKELDKLAELNKCYSNFTAPRQIAIQNQFKTMGDVFSLGHWGDVLLGSMNLPELYDEAQVDVVVNLLLKKGGLEFASTLWKAWVLSGSFEDYFRERISTLLQNIHITNTNAKLRAFKSTYWAPRWTSINLSVFSAIKPITLPYYDDRMCQFICTVPEEYLKHRQLQIAYIKTKAPDLAGITWQDQRPFNLNNFHLNKMPYNLPYKVIHKLKRSFNNNMGKPYVQRNWELQFVGNDNEIQLKRFLLESNLKDFISEDIIKFNYNAFIKGNKVHYAHPINILLVLSKFNQIYNYG